MNPNTTRVALLERIITKSARVGIIGMGYVGLPLATVFARAGFRVTGIDVSKERMARLNNGQSYIEDVPDQLVATLREAGLLEGTTDYKALAELDAVSICVPTPLRKTRDPDISYIVHATEQIARYLHRGQVIILESTTYPGTTREVILPQLQAQGLIAGQDYFLAFSPERVDPGRTDWTTFNTPKVMGGVTPACLEVAKALYERAINKIVPVSSPEAAEMVKLLENTFRAVNIGLVNEVLLMCDKLGLDAWEVIEAAATKPFGFMKFTPGPGLGGHCIPVDPHYLSWKLKTLNYTARFIDLASEVNAAMPAYWVQQVQDRLNEAGKPVKGSKILVLGIAYKKDVGDIRESPALDIIHLLISKGALVSYHDPYVPRFANDGIAMESVVDWKSALNEVDCVVIATDHSQYDWSVVAASAAKSVDTRNVLAHAASGAVRPPRGDELLTLQEKVHD
jgi:UDP-N-acetyl-D-glucosamine dehydrogenase